MSPKQAPKQRGRPLNASRPIQTRNPETGKFAKEPRVTMPRDFGTPTGKPPKENECTLAAKTTGGKPI